MNYLPQIVASITRAPRTLDALEDALYTAYVDAIGESYEVAREIDFEGGDVESDADYIEACARSREAYAVAEGLELLNDLRMLALDPRGATCHRRGLGGIPF